MAVFQVVDTVSPDTAGRCATPIALGIDSTTLVTRVTGGLCRLAQTRAAGKHILNGGGRPALTFGRRGNDGRRRVRNANTTYPALVAPTDAGRDSEAGAGTRRGRGARLGLVRCACARPVRR